MVTNVVHHLRRGVWRLAIGIVLAMLSAPALAFDCAKATLGVDFVLCSHDRLIRVAERLDDAWKAAKSNLSPEQAKILLEDQRKWVLSYGQECGLPAKGRPAEDVMQQAQWCVLGKVNERISFLSSYTMAGGGNYDRTTSSPSTQVPQNGEYEWEVGGAQGTSMAYVLNDNNARISVNCPFGWPDRSPYIWYDASSKLPVSLGSTVPISLIIDGRKKRLYTEYVAREGSLSSLQWTAGGHRSSADMTELVAALRQASSMAVEVLGTEVRDEFSTKNAAVALNGILGGCVDAAQRPSGVAQQTITRPAPASPISLAPPVSQGLASQDGFEVMVAGTDRANPENSNREILISISTKNELPGKLCRIHAYVENHIGFNVEGIDIKGILSYPDGSPMSTLSLLGLAPVKNGAGIMIETTGQFRCEDIGGVRIDRVYWRSIGNQNWSNATSNTRIVQSTIDIQSQGAVPTSQGSGGTADRVRDRGTLQEAHAPSQQAGRVSASLTMLELAIHPISGSRDKWKAYLDQRNSSIAPLAFGLNIVEVVASYKKNGSVSEISLRIPRAMSAKDLRDALAKICSIADGNWSVQQGSFQAGEGAGATCKAIYAPFNEMYWVVAYTVP